MKRHPTDGLSLTFGLIFLAVVAWWVVAHVVDISLPHAGWFVAGALIVVGLLGLVNAVRRDDRTVPGPTVPDPIGAQTGGQPDHGAVASTPTDAGSTDRGSTPPQ